MGRTLNRGETARPRTPGRGYGVRLSYNARKKSLTSGPGWSAAGNDACASAACGWARDWAGVPGFGPSGEEHGPARKETLAFVQSGDKELHSGLEKGMGRAGKPWAAAAASLRAEKEEKKVIHFFFRSFLQSKFKMKFQLNSKSNFKPSNSK